MTRVKLFRCNHTFYRDTSDDSIVLVDDSNEAATLDASRAITVGDGGFLLPTRAGRVPGATPATADEAAMVMHNFGLALDIGSRVHRVTVRASTHEQSAPATPATKAHAFARDERADVVKEVDTLRRDLLRGASALGRVLGQSLGLAPAQEASLHDVIWELATVENMLNTAVRLKAAASMLARWENAAERDGKGS